MHPRISAAVARFFKKQSAAFNAAAPRGTSLPDIHLNKVTLLDFSFSFFFFIYNGHCSGPPLKYYRSLMMWKQNLPPLSRPHKTHQRSFSTWGWAQSDPWWDLLPLTARSWPKPSFYRATLWHSLCTLNSRCNSPTWDDEVRRLAAGSERGLPETLTFVLDMKDDVSGSFWDILSLFFFFYLCG